MDFVQLKNALFYQNTGCFAADTVAEDCFSLGESRLCDVEDFTVAFMRVWVNQPEFAPVGFASFSPLQKQTLYKNRFCTLDEFLLLFTAPTTKIDSPVFTLLGITNESERTKYKNLFPPNINGYYQLMQVVNPSLQSFFFSGYSRLKSPLGKNKNIPTLLVVQVQVKVK